MRVSGRPSGSVKGVGLKVYWEGWKGSKVSSSGRGWGVGRGGRFGVMVRERRWEAEPERWSVPKR